MCLRTNFDANVPLVTASACRTCAGIALSDADRLFDEFERAAGEDNPDPGHGAGYCEGVMSRAARANPFCLEQRIRTIFELQFPIAYAGTGIWLA